jgi:hypothetical protein
MFELGMALLQANIQHSISTPGFHGKRFRQPLMYRESPSKATAKGL